MTHQEIRKYCRPDAAGMKALESSVAELGLSARAHDKILRVARTIADLAGDEKVHVDEAINYRMLDRNLWT